MATGRRTEQTIPAFLFFWLPIFKRNFSKTAKTSSATVNHVTTFPIWSLSDVLMEKYKLCAEQNT